MKGTKCQKQNRGKLNHMYPIDRSFDGQEPAEQAGVSRHARSSPNDDVVFLGKVMPQDEYEQSCKNLNEFFSILREWKERRAK